LLVKHLHIVLFTMFLTMFGTKVFSQTLETSPKTPTIITTDKKTTPDTTKTSAASADTVKVKSSAALESIVKYKAANYAKLQNQKKLVTLYDKAELYYQDVELKSGIIVINYQNNEAYAGRIKDSSKVYSQYPYFKQAMNVVEPDSMKFNYKTKKAWILNSRTEQGEFKVKGEQSKRENDSVIFIKGAKFTTSKDIDDPEYYFLARKTKLVPRKKVVTGLVNMHIAEVPTPIALPFAFFPMTTDSQSGIIVPNPVDTQRQGFSLQNGGLYMALSDNYDLTILGDYFTNGSYALRFETAYAWKYKFRGNFNIRFENQIQSERGFPDYAKSSIYNVQWSHQQDPKSSPNSRFSASVNLGSSRFFQQSLNQVNVSGTLINNLSSSISYSKTFDTYPQVNMSLTASHNQNTQTQEINMTLPTLQANVDRIFPFAKRDGAKKGVIQNINLQYNIRGENRYRTTDSLFFKPQMFKDAVTGFQHQIPVSTNFKMFKYFSFTTGANFQETWTFKTIDKFFENSQNQVVTNTVNGFDRYLTYNFNSSVGTTIYGTFNFGEDKKIQSIRHVVRPSVSYNYAPSFANYYDNYVVDASGRVGQFSRFEGGVFGAPTLGISNNIGLSLSNTFEAKVRDRDSTKVEPKKIMLLNTLNFSTSYNIAADSLRLAPLSVNGGTTLFDNKMQVNFSTTLDPYALNAANQRINQLNINNGGSLFRMTSANFNMNYSLDGRKSKNKKPNEQGARNGGRPDDLFGRSVDLSNRRQSQFGDEEEENEAEVSEFYKSSIPFDMNFAYTITYGNANRENRIVGHSLMVSANVDLSPKWRIGASTGYDFVQNGVTFTQLRFERDLLSWRMDFNWTPFGQNAFWGFFIGIKSSALQDIKWERNRLPDRVLR
jgi:lipopolysaccharide assembly outer membrane protein LptD (OstA)